MSAMSYLDFVKSIEKSQGLSSSRVRNERRPAGTWKKLSFENLPVFVAGSSLIGESFPDAKRLFFRQTLFEYWCGQIATVLWSQLRSRNLFVMG
jgi:hypothetical protein